MALKLRHSIKKIIGLNVLLAISNGVIVGLDYIVDLTSLRATEIFSFSLLELLLK